MSKDSAFVEKRITELKDKASRALGAGRCERAMAAIAACSKLLYLYNQYYTDKDLEEMAMELSVRIVHPEKKQVVHSGRTILYYDGFGLDLRGNAIVMTRTMASLGYRLIYVTSRKAMGKQPNLVRELSRYDVEFAYIDMTTSYLGWVKGLNDLFTRYAPDDAFFYTTPWDVAGTVVFNRYEGLVNRFYCDLTDHAYWLGIHTFDYILNNRTIGQSIQRLYRGIPESKQIRSPGFLYVNEAIQLEPLPFDTDRHPYIFSGGALYKTLGDEEKTYYRIVEYILSHYENICFVYAGTGDDREFQKLMAKYSGRIFLFGEREDFFQLIQGSLFYLNTYPMFGGLMMRFAAYAKKIPLTLRHDRDSDDNLLHQHELGIEFESYDEIIQEIDKLICDDVYRIRKEDGLSRGFISYEEYCRFYQRLLEEHTSDTETIVEPMDTTAFRRAYLNRMNGKKISRDAICTLPNRSLLMDYPALFIEGFATKLIGRFLK